jgi:hypothetical protein
VNCNTRDGDKMASGHALSGKWRLHVKGWGLVAILFGSFFIFVLSLILGIIFRGLFSGAWEGTFSMEGLIFIPVILGLIVAVIIVHEAIHGLLFAILGGQPRFGFKLIGRFFPVFFATSRAYFPRNRYVFIALSPFLILTPALIVTGILATADNIATLVLIAMALNVSGSIGDFAAAYNMLRHNQKTFFEDTEDGFNWYVPSRVEDTIRE